MFELCSAQICAALRVELRSVVRTQLREQLHTRTICGHRPEADSSVISSGCASVTSKLGQVKTSIFLIFLPRLAPAFLYARSFFLQSQGRRAREFARPEFRRWWRPLSR